MYNNLIEPHTPKEWELNGENLVAVYPGTPEYNKVETPFYNKNFDVANIYRHEDLNKYGQFMLRQQTVSVMYPKTQYYRAVRYVDVQTEDYDDIQDAINCNLDPRRCSDFDVVYQTELSVIYGAVFVCSIFTSNPYVNNFIPQKSSDVYIKYVVYVED